MKVLRTCDFVASIQNLYQSDFINVTLASSERQFEAHKLKKKNLSVKMKKAVNAPDCDEIVTIEDHVKSSEVLKNMSSLITFEYNLSD